MHRAHVFMYCLVWGTYDNIMPIENNVYKPHLCLKLYTRNLITISDVARLHNVSELFMLLQKEGIYSY